MAKVQFVTYETAAPIQTPAAQRGQIESRGYFNKASDPLHLLVHQLGPNAALHLSGGASDALAYIWKGSVIVRGVRLCDRSSLIVEHGSSVEVSALDAGASILVFSPRAQPQRERAGFHVHLLPRERVPSNADLNNVGTLGGSLHADASSACCELWLHENDFHVGGTPVGTHSHSEEEIIFVSEGELCVGKHRYGPGAALAIGANVKYGFQVGSGGLSFVNFRAAAPTYTPADGQNPMDEAEFWKSQTGRPEHLHFQIG